MATFFLTSNNASESGEKYELNDYSKHLIGRHFKLIKDLPKAATDNPISIQEVLEKGQTGDICCFRGRGFTSRGIEGVSGDCYSHAVVLYRGKFTRKKEEDGVEEVYGEDGRLQIFQATGQGGGEGYTVVVNGVPTKRPGGVVLSPFEEVYLDEYLVEWGEIGCWYQLQCDDEEKRRQMAIDMGAFAGHVAHCEYDGGIVHMSLVHTLMGLFNVPARIDREKYYCSSLVAACLMKGGILPEEIGGRRHGHSVLNYTPGILGDTEIMNSRTINGFSYAEPRVMQRDVDLNDPEIQKELEAMYELTGEGPDGRPYPHHLGADDAQPKARILKSKL